MLSFLIASYILSTKSSTYAPRIAGKSSQPLGKVIRMLELWGYIMFVGCWVIYVIDSEAYEYVINYFYWSIWHDIFSIHHYHEIILSAIILGWADGVWTNSFGYSSSWWNWTICSSGQWYVCCSYCRLMLFIRIYLFPFLYGSVRVDTLKQCIVLSCYVL